MWEKLKKLKDRFDELTRQLSDPDVIADTVRWQSVVKERSSLESAVALYDEWLECDKSERECREIIEDGSDKDMCALAREELTSVEERKEKLEEELKFELLPKDPDDDKNVIMEFRAGAGGEEAALFAYELYRMYVNYCERHRFRIEEVDKNDTELGGIKEVVLNISGKGAYSRLKFQSGVHRVQRVPETESQGRIHTSTVTVAVLPEAEDVDVEIRDEDIRVDVYRSSGAGGQKVNKTETAIRITHFPTGIVVTCQDERSQLKNKDKAFKVLRSRLYDYYSGLSQSQQDKQRKSLVGRGDRSERIRTYNFPQGRVTDHRIGLSLYSLDGFIMGDIDEMIDALAVAERENALAAQEND